MRAVSWRWPVRLGLLAGGVVVSLVLVELALRGLGFPTRTLEFTPSGVPGYALMRPNQEFLERGWHAHQPPHRIRVNSLGFRGPEPSPERRWTILALGDSFTFGPGVEDEQTFAAVLAERLRSRFGAGIEVVNAGHSGAGIDHELVVFERRGRSLRPDVVLLQFFANDIDDLLEREARERVYRPINFPLKRHVRQTATYLLLLRLKLQGRRTAVARAAATEGAETETLPFRDSGYYSRVLPERLERGWDEYLGYLGRLAAGTDLAGSRLVVLIVPDRYQVTRADLHPTPQERIETFARDRGIPVVDPLPTFRRLAARDEVLYLPEDGHLSPRGHAVLGQLLLEVLVEHRLVPR